MRNSSDVPINVEKWMQKLQLDVIFLYTGVRQCSILSA